MCSLPFLIDTSRPARTTERTTRPTEGLRTVRNRSKIRAAAIAAAALAAPLTFASSAHASTGGGCRAWYSYSGLNISVRPCISASGNTVNGSGYLSGSGLVSRVEVDLVRNGSTVATITDWCDPVNHYQVPAGQCTAADNVSFGPWVTGYTYYVDEKFCTDILCFSGVYGPTESPGLYLS
jgi:hypothetical protein